MKLPGFTAEASVYITARHYYAGTASVADYGGVYPAQQTCPPWCVGICEHACRTDGESQAVCTKLCQYDCGAYGTGAVVSCGSCVNNVQTCTLCGGDTVTRSCGTSVVCAPGLTNCGGTCKNLSLDSFNCGACGQTCSGGMICTGGGCACPPGLTNCGGTCANLATDPMNCGACGANCGAGFSCGCGGTWCCPTGTTCVPVFTWKFCI